MNESNLIEDIITTKNTLTILHQVYVANESSLKPFASIFDSISSLIDILTHASTEHIENAVRSTGSKFSFIKLKETLNELSDAITRNNTSSIPRLNKELESSVEKLRIDPSYVTSRGATADEQFKKQLQQPPSDTNDRYDSERAQPPPVSTSIPQKNSVSRLPAPSTQSEQECDPSIMDEFSKFRFARRRRVSDSSQDDDEIKVTGPVRPPKPIVSLPTRSPNADLSSKPRLMISYNHVSKSLCTDIYNHLTEDGYNVWIDFKQMHGSTLMAMAQAIEDSDIIVFCMTENYSTSVNCQKEAEYAFVRQKIMIPLLLQAKYKPTGWLGFLLGASFYIDFTKNDFTQNYQTLKNEIETNAKRINNNKNEVVKLTCNSTMDGQEARHQQLSSAAPPSTGVKSNTTVNKSRGCVLL